MLILAKGLYRRLEDLVFEAEAKGKLETGVKKGFK